MDKQFKMRDGNLYLIIIISGEVTTAILRVPPGMRPGGMPSTVKATVRRKNGDVYSEKVGVHQAVRAAKLKFWGRARAVQIKAIKRLKAAVFAGKVFQTNPFEVTNG